MSSTGSGALPFSGPVRNDSVTIGAAQKEDMPPTGRCVLPYGPRPARPSVTMVLRSNRWPLVLGAARLSSLPGAASSARGRAGRPATALVGQQGRRRRHPGPPKAPRSSTTAPERSSLSPTPPAPHRPTPLCLPCSLRDLAPNIHGARDNVLGSTGPGRTRSSSATLKRKVSSTGSPG